MNLYELSQNYLAVQEMDLEPETLKDTLDSIADAAVDKIEKLVRLMRNNEGDINSIKSEEERLKKKRQSLENYNKFFKQYIEDAMRLMNQTRLKAGFFHLAIQNNQPSVEVFDEALLPERFLIEQPPKIDRAGIKELLKAGEEVPGAELKQTEGLRIR